MLVLCKSAHVRQGGYRWRFRIAAGWELRWQRLGCFIVAETSTYPIRPAYPPKKSTWPW